MNAKGMKRARLFLIEGLCLALMAVLVLSVRADVTAPAFGADWEPETTEPLTVSVQGLVLSRRGMAQNLLRTALPIIDYSETLMHHDESQNPFATLAGYFLGFVPRYSRDLAFAGISGFLVDSETLDPVIQTANVEKDWEFTPVLYSLPPGEATIPATIATGTDPMVAIYHTHATESFLPEVGKSDATQAFSDNMQRTVVNVGEIFAQELQSAYRIPTLHSSTVHDANTRVGAYYRSESTVKAVLQKYPDCQVLVDIHRDSQPRSITGVTIRGKSYARLLIVIGTDNPTWVSNNEFARKILDKLDEGYPGLSRGIMFESAIYNQKYSPKAILVEFGGVDNTMEECRNSAQALAWAMASVMLNTSPARP